MFSRAKIFQLRWWARGSAVVAMIIAAIVLVGWQLDIEIFKTIIPGYTSMKANTAVALGLIALASYLLNLRPSPARNRMALACAAIAGMIGVATLGEYVTGWDLHIDQLLYFDNANVGLRYPPGRLAPVTAITLILLWAGVILAHGSSRYRYFRTAQLACFAAAVTSFQALVSYVLGVQTSFGLAAHTRIAIHTAVGFVCVCFALASASSLQGFMRIFTAKTDGGQSARRLLVAAVFVPPTVHALQLFAEKVGLFDADFGTLFRTVCSVVFFVVMVWKNSEKLHDSEVIRNRDERERVRLLAAGQLAEVVQRNEMRLRAMFDSAFDAIVGTDSQGLITEWNSRAEVMFGFTKAEAIGRSMSDTLVPDELRDTYRGYIKAYLTTGTAPVFHRATEQVALRKSGERFPIQLAVSPIKVGEEIFFIAFIADISERKRNEAELIVTRQRALDAATAKAEFLANMSHEIRTPMNGIVGMTDLLLDTQLNDGQRKYAQIVQDSCQTLLTIINDILDFSKIDAGKVRLEPVDFEVRPLINSQIELLSPKASAKNVELKWTLDDSVPDTVHADSGRIAQVLLNLIGNAIKFTQAGSITVRVTAEKSALNFSVADTGIGLSPTEITRLFQPFSQADNSTARKYGGTGLGLSISKKLVDLMGGKIGVESLPGHGSVFWFTCPYKSVGPSLLVESTPRLTPAVAPSRNLTNFRVLVVEDNYVNQLLALTYLRKAGYHAQAVGNGREAVDLTDTSRFDLILMDCQMPEMDGYQATRLIREREANLGVHTPIIALTANAMKSDRDQCLAAGMDSFLSKPIKMDKLVEEIDLQLRKLKKTA